jgi:hypothetical protein
MAAKFVWRVHLRQDVLDDAMAELRGLPHEVLRQIVSQPLKKRVRGRDQKLYNLTVTAEWVTAESEDLEITVRLKRGWFGKPLTDGFRANAPFSGGAPTIDEEGIT